MNNLWENPDFNAKIMINSDLNEIKDFLAPLICNNFYQNIISPYTIEENLLYIITIVLKDEINKYNENALIYNNFLENDVTCALLNEFKKRENIKLYAKNIIFDVIQKIEYDDSNFNIDDIFNLNLELKKDLINENDEEKIKLFDKNYFNNLTKEGLNIIINKEENKNIKDYISQLMLKFENIKSNNFKYSPSFKINFIKIIEIFDIILAQIQNQIIPIEIKYISKIIYLLTKQKFDKLNQHEIYIILYNFIFKILLVPLFKSPLDIYINEFIISDNTLLNLNKILQIFSQLLSFNLYNNKEDDYIYFPFILYFITKFGDLFKYYEKVINVDLPSFIELFIKAKSNKRFEYNFFNENKTEIMIHRSILFSLDDIKCLIRNINRSKDQLFQNGSYNKIFDIYNKLNTEVNLKLLNNLDIIHTSKKNKNYILLQELLINPRYDYLFISDTQKQKEYYYINELSDIDDENKESQNLIIKIKNYISYILYYYQSLSLYNFSKNDNLISIFSGLKKYLINSEKKYYFEYYIKSLLDCLKKIDKKYSFNDFELLLDELKNEINNSIELIDFYMMSNILAKIKNCEQKIQTFKNYANEMKDIEINEKAKDIVFNKTNFIFNINKNIICKSIEEYTNYISNLKEIPDNIAIDIKYNFKFIFDILDKDKSYKDKNELLIKIKEKISDYIFIKLYNKLFPQIPTKNDSLILMNCEKLSWIKPENLIKNCNNFDIFIEEFIPYFAQIEKERNPKKKFNIFIKIFDIISKVIEFLGNDEENKDKSYIDILKYIIIYIKPKKFNSEIDYIQSFFDGNNEEDNKKFKILYQVCEIMKNIKYTDLINISEEEFIFKCSQSK